MPLYNPASSLTFNKQKATPTTSAPTTTSGTFVVIPQMTVTLVSTGADVMVDFSAAANLQNGDDWNLAAFVDGVQSAITNRRLNQTGTAPLLGVAPALPGLPIAMSAVISGISAGSRVIDIRWAVTAGAARLIGTNRTFSVIEVP